MNELRSASTSGVHADRQQWMPKSISYAFGEPIVELAALGHVPGPFISDLDLQHASATRRMPLMDIPAAQLEACAEPAGFIFHLPRSGSTLLARMLTAAPGAAVIVEPEPINQLLSGAAPGALRVEWLRRLVRLYGGATGPFPQLVLKLSSWSVLQAPMFAEAFPRARCGFVHRDPLEVLVQLLDRPTGWMAPHAWPVIFGEPRGSARMTGTEYCARALGRFLRVAASTPGLRSLAYEHILAEGPGVVAYLLSRPLEPALVDAVLRVAHLDSEDWAQTRAHVPDSEALRSRATPLAREMVERFAVQERQDVMRGSGG